MEQNQAPTKSQLPRLIVAWLFVGIPATWGVTQTVTQSLQLFKTAAPSPRTRMLERFLPFVLKTQSTLP